MIMGSRDPMDWWDTPLLGEHGWDKKLTDSFTGGHMGDHQSNHYRTRDIVAKDLG